MIDLASLLDWINILLVPLVYFMRNIDKRITRMEIINEIANCSNCINHKPKGQ